MKDWLSDYVAATNDASKRSRWVLLVLIVTLVFVFAAYHNSKQNAWLRYRVELTSVALKCVRQAPCNGEDDHRARAFLLAWKFVSDDDAKLTFAAIASAYPHLEREIDSQLNHQRQLLLDNVVKLIVPFLGFQFDINDLGLYAGIAFVTVMAMLHYSLRREHGNIEFCLQAPGQPAGDEVRKLLLMKQVFAGVQQQGTGMLSAAILRRLPLLPVVLPVILQGAIVYMDFSTFENGRALSVPNTIALYIAEGAALIACFFLTLYCIDEMLKIDRCFRPPKG